MHVTVALCAYLTLASGAAPAPSGAWMLEFGLTGEQLQARAVELQKAGYRPLRVSGYNDGEFPRFAVLWGKGGEGAWRMEFGLTPAQFDRRAATLKSEGYRLGALSGYEQGGTQGFIDVWLKGDVPAYEVEYGVDAEGLGRLARGMKGKGYRPVDLSSYVSGTITRYATIWEKGGEEAWDLKWGLSGEMLEGALNTMTTSGYRPVALTGLAVEEEVRYSAIWVKRKGPAWEVRYNQDGEALLELARTMRSRGYRPVHLAGYGTLRGIRFASIWEQVSAK